MLNIFIRLLLVFAAFFTSWFVARDELHFPIAQMIVAVILFTIAVAIMAFWPIIKNWFKEM